VELHDAPVEDATRDVGSETVATMRRLSPEHRAVIVLRHLLGYTPGQIARILDVPRGTVNSRLRRGLDELKGQL
jgi:RNA polymerase sigma-70 factor, ECF subfamily